MKLSVVVTMYNSALYIEEFYQRISSIIQDITDQYEIVLVDDGSPDDSLVIAKQLLNKDGRIKIVELARNHGHHRAMMIGLAQSSGEHIYLTDIDLEEAPENLSAFWSAMHDGSEVDVVFGSQGEKDSPPIRKFLSRTFYNMFNSLSDVNISSTELVSRLMTRDFVDNLLRYGESSIFLPAIWTDVGFKKRSIELQKTFNGNSTYTIKKRIVLAVDAVTSFSAKPLVFVFYSGVSISILASIFIAYLVVDKLLYNSPLLGWTSLIASIFLMGGLILFSLGVIGIYISKIYLEVKARPKSIIRQIHSHSTVKSPRQ